MMRHTPESHREPEHTAPGSNAAFGAPETDAADSDVPSRPAPEPVHRWLDGESIADNELGKPESEKHVKFWAKVNEETERRRRLRTPSGLDAIIMDKLDTPVVNDD